MADYITLLGAEGVERAGREISGAADRMERASASVHETAFMLSQRFDQVEQTFTRTAEAFEKFADALEKAIPILERVVAVLEKEQHYAGN